MKDVVWHIETDSNNSNLGWLVAGTDAAAAWPYFFSGINLRDYPKLIDSTTNEVGYDSNGVGIDFIENDSADVNLSSTAKDVEIYVPGFEDSILSYSTFCSILFEFGKKLLDVHSKEKEWYDTQQKSLDKLRKKMQIQSYI